MQREARLEIDFDDWSKLAARDPEAFERRRSQVLEDFIRDLPASKQLRMRRLQWRVDRAREQAANPVAACVRLSQMMWDSVTGEDGLLQVLSDPYQPSPRPRRIAEVLAFRTHH